MLTKGWLDLAARIALIQVSKHVGQQGEQILTPVVAGHVGVKLLPLTLDAVAIGALRGQEVELDATAQGGELVLHLLALVDAVVVQDDVDGLGVGIDLDQVVEQTAE